MNLKFLKVVLSKFIYCSLSYYYFMFYLQGSHFEHFYGGGHPELHACLFFFFGKCTFIDYQNCKNYNAKQD